MFIAPEGFGANKFAEAESGDFTDTELAGEISPAEMDGSEDGLEGEPQELN